MTGGTPKPPRYKPATFTPLNPDSLTYTDIQGAQDLATQTDRDFYARSDADFAARHPDLVAANQQNEKNISAAVKGEIPAGLEGAYTRAGLGNVLGAFGGSGGAAPGSIGEYGVARNLGVNFLDYDRAVKGELAQINAATPERAFGLGGQAALGLRLSNDQLRNNAIIGNFQGANQVALSNSTGGNNSAQGGFAAALNANNAALQAYTGLASAGANAASRVDWGSLFSSLGSSAG